MHQFFRSGIQSKKSKDQKPHLPLSFFLYFFLLQIFLIFIMDSPNSFGRVPLHKECKHLLPKRKTYQNTQEEQEEDGMNPKPKPVPCVRKLDFFFQRHANQISVLILTSRYRILQDSEILPLPFQITLLLSLSLSLSLNTHTHTHTLSLSLSLSLARHTLKTFRDSQISFSLQHSQNCQKRL
jgi:hypothetical protein